jgi:mannosyltransferase
MNIKRICPYYLLILLFLTIAVGFMLRIYNLDYLSLWNDELFSRYYYQLGLRYMWTVGLELESSPPVYYMAIGAWMQIFGFGEAAMRSLSVVSSTIAIIIIYFLGRQLWDERRSLLAAILLSLSAAQIYYAQEARPYALLLIPLMATLLVCTRYLQDTESNLNLFGYFTGAVLCIYTHATMVFFVAACGITILVWLITQPQLRLRNVPRWVGINIGVILVSLPELIGMYWHVSEDRLSWIPPPRLSMFAKILSNTVVGPLAPQIFPGVELSVASFGMLVWILWRHRPDARACLITLVIPGLYAGLVLLGSLIAQPILLGRIFLWTGVPLYLAQAYALFAPGAPSRIFAAITVVVMATGLFYQLAPSPDAKEPWRRIIQALSRDLSEADIVVLTPETDAADLIYYAPPMHQVREWRDTRSLTRGPMGTLFDITPITTAEIVELVNRRAHVLIVHRMGGWEPLPNLLSQTRWPEKWSDPICGMGASDSPCGPWILAWRGNDEP